MGTTPNSQNDSHLKMGSDESRFKVSFTVKSKITKLCPQTATFEERGEQTHGIELALSAYQPSALLLGKCTHRYDEKQGNNNANLFHWVTLASSYSLVPPITVRPNQLVLKPFLSRFLTNCAPDQGLPFFDICLILRVIIKNRVQCDGINYQHFQMYLHGVVRCSPS